LKYPADAIGADNSINPASSFSTEPNPMAAEKTVTQDCSAQNLVTMRITVINPGDSQ
jgi:hypothetical protein